MPISVINCGYPGYLEQGRVSGNSYLYGDTVSYSCYPGVYYIKYHYII